MIPSAKEWNTMSQGSFKHDALHVVWPLGSLGECTRSSCLVTMLRSPQQARQSDRNLVLQCPLPWRQGRLLQKKPSLVNLVQQGHYEPCSARFLRWRNQQKWIGCKKDAKGMQDIKTKGWSSCMNMAYGTQKPSHPRSIHLNLSILVKEECLA